MEPVLRLERIAKSFGPVSVLHGVDLEIRSGEVHSLVGENGAGKSTLMRIAAGIHQPDAGRMLLGGEPYSPRAPRDAINSGIAMVHQELSLAPDVTIAENIFIGSDTGKELFVDWKSLNSRATKVLADFCLDVDPTMPVSALSVGYRQVIEILKALATNPRVIIFDEPTSSLEAHESALVLDTIGRLAAKSIAVVYISHRMDEVFRISDRITVLRDGALVGNWNAAEISREQVINAMVGREMTELYPPRTEERGEELLRVDKLSRGRSFEGISFSLHKGEILGFSGLVGAGRTEVMRAIFGAEPAQSGAILVRGKPVRIAGVKDAMAAGIAYVPEERKVDGLFLDRSVEDNIVSGNLDLCSRSGWMIPELSRALAENACRKLRVIAHSLSQGTGTLSGGNQQKVLLVRWLTTKPGILIVDEPTRGVDVGAKVEIHRILREYAQAGNGVIVVSSEMPEIIGLCDRIVVLREGTVAGELPGKDATEEKLVKLAVG